jgi:hypothetical protein
MIDRSVRLVGGWAAVIGGLLAVVVNVLQPRNLDEPTAVTAVNTTAWELLQVGVMVVILLALLAFYVVTRTIEDSPAREWARIGLGATLMGSTLGIAQFSILATFGQSAAPEAMVSASFVEGGLFRVWVITFFGLAAVLYGLAFMMSAEYPTWLGWVALLAGVVGLVTGISDTLLGITDVSTFILFPITSGLTTLVIIYLGVRLLRGSST